MTSSTKASLSKKKQQKQQPPQQPNSFNRSSSVSSIGSNHTIKSNYTSNNSTSTSNIPANGTPNPKKRGRDGGLLSPINTSNSSSNPSSKSNSANSTPSASPTRLISSNSAIPNNLHRDADGSLLSSQESEESSSFLSQSPNPNPRKLKGIMRDKKSGGISMGVGEKKEMYERMVKGAFEGRKNGDFGAYQDLITSFQLSTIGQDKKPINPSSPENLKYISSVLIALTNHSTELDRPHTTLVTSIVNLPWFSSTPAIFNAHSRFIYSLCTARGEWTSLVLKSIVSAFAFQPFAKNKAGSSRVGLFSLLPDDVLPPTRAVISDRLHAVLERLNQLVPALPSILGPILLKNFPNKRDGRNDWMVYCRNCLRVGDYAEEVKEDVMRIIADRSIGFDVEIQIEIDELDSEDEDVEIPDDISSISKTDSSILGTSENSQETEASTQPSDTKASASELVREGASSDLVLDGPQTELSEEELRFKLKEEKKEFKRKKKEMELIKEQEREERRKKRNETRNPWEIVLGEEDYDGDSEEEDESLDEHMNLPEMEGIDGTKPNAPGNGYDLDAISSDEESEDDDDLPTLNGLVRQVKKLGSKDKDKIRDLFGKLDGIMEVVFEHLNEREKGFQELQRNYDELYAEVNQQMEEFQRIVSANQVNDEGDIYAKHQGRISSIEAKRLNLEDLKQKLEKRAESRYQEFSTLLSTFRKTILPTYRSRHTQFLLFWFTSLDKIFVDEFLGMLVNGSVGGILTDENTASGISLNSNLQNHIINSSTSIINIRIHCAYLSSFVSRARHCPPVFCKAIVQMLIEYLETHLQRHIQLKDSGVDEGKEEGDRIHQGWYAIAQAVMYIFCFRWRDLQNDRDLANDSGNGSQSQLPSADVMKHSNYNHPESKEDHLPSLTALSPILRPIDPSTSNQDDDGDEAPEGQNESSGWLTSLTLFNRSIFSSLNPLAHCHPTVVSQFAEVAGQTGYAFCWAKIEDNRNIKNQHGSRDGLPNQPVVHQYQESGLNGTEEENVAAGIRMKNVNGHKGQSSGQGFTNNQSQLDAFFPFDPYRLENSQRFLDGIYREWEDVKPDNWVDDSGSEEDASEEDSDSDSDEDEDDDEEEEVKRVGSTALDIPGAMGKRDNRKKAEESRKLRGKGKGKEVRDRNKDNDVEGMLLDEGVSKSLGAMSMSYTP